MRMALSTAHGQSEPHGTRRVDSVDNRFIPKLLRVDTAFLVVHRIAVEASRDELIQCGIRQQVSGDLLDRKLIERHIGIEGSDDPVSIRPDRPWTVLFVTIGVGVAG